MSLPPRLSKGVGTCCFPLRLAQERSPGHDPPGPIPPASKSRSEGSVLLKTSPVFGIVEIGPCGSALRLPLGHPKMSPGISSDK